ALVQAGHDSAKQDDVVVVAALIAVGDRAVELRLARGVGEVGQAGGALGGFPVLKGWGDVASLAFLSLEGAFGLGLAGRGGHIPSYQTWRADASARWGGGEVGL